MKHPTDAQQEAARVWLAEWVPKYTVGQWAALAELLASLEGTVARESTPTELVERKPKPGMWVYLVRKPGHELDGSPAELYAPDAESARERSQAHARSIGATLTFVGRWVDPTSERHRRFEASIPYAELPHWAQQWIDTQAEALAKVKRTKRGRAA